MEHALRVERFRIAQYGFIQMVALTYSILVSSLMVKANAFVGSQGLTSRSFFTMVALFHDYGIVFSLIVISWAIFCAYHTTTFSKQNLTESEIVMSGLFLSGVFGIVGLVLTFMGLGALFSPTL